MCGRVGVDHPSPPQELLLCRYNNASNHWGLLNGQVNAEVVVSIQRAISWIV